MPVPDRSHALDHIVVVLFENRSLDNVLGHLYGPGDGKTFDGVIGKDLSNPIPAWAEHGADRKVVQYTVATDMDSPNPDSGEEYYHTNTQLYNIIDDHNRFKIGDAAAAPWNAPPPGTAPTMDGFVTDYISTFTGETGRQPTYDEYAHIMTGCTPGQLPVLNGIARDFGVFDHRFCEVPSQTFMNRSFWTAATSSGFVVNSPIRKWMEHNDAETIFDRLEAHGRTWKVYVMEPMALSFTGVIHFPRLKDRLATHFVPFAEFEKGAAAGTLPDFSLIEPNMMAAHGDYHPAMGRSFSDKVDLDVDSPSSMLAGEAFLERVYGAYRSATSQTGANVWNTALLIGWDEPGGTYDHVPPGASPAAGPGCACWRVRLRVRALRVPGAGHRRVAVGRTGVGVQRGVPSHLPDRHVAEDLGTGYCVHAAGRLGPHVRSRLLARHAPRPANLGCHDGASRARMDDGPRGRRQGPEHPGQGHRTRHHRQGQADGGQASGRTQRPGNGANTQAHRRHPQGHRRSLLPAASSRRERPPMN
jgi:phospholipase C